MNEKIAERRSRGLYWDRAWKLVEGCTKVSPGCDNCWSEQETVMRAGHPNAIIKTRAEEVLVFSENGYSLGRGSGPKFSGHVLCREDNLDLPLRTKKPTVWAIWNDLYHKGVSDEFRDRAYAVMALCPQHTFLVLTKRAEGMAEYWDTPGRRPSIGFVAANEFNEKYRMLCGGPDPYKPFPNVWHGVTAENQEQYNKRYSFLRDVPGKRFLSIEPMLGPMKVYLTGIDAVLLGGESGKDARPMHPDWVRSVRDQCAAAGVPFYFKQWGEWAEASNGPQPNDRLLAVPHPVYPDCGIAAVMRKVGKKKAGRTLDGRLHDALPWGSGE